MKVTTKSKTRLTAVIICCEAARLLDDIQTDGLPDIVEFDARFCSIPTTAPNPAQRTVGFAVAKADLTLSLDAFSEKYLRSAMLCMAAQLGNTKTTADSLVLPLGVDFAAVRNSLRLLGHECPATEDDRYAYYTRYYSVNGDEFTNGWVQFVLRFDTVLVEPSDA